MKQLTAPEIMQRQAKGLPIYKSQLPASMTTELLNELKLEVKNDRPETVEECYEIIDKLHEKGFENFEKISKLDTEKEEFSNKLTEKEKEYESLKLELEKKPLKNDEKDLKISELTEQLNGYNELKNSYSEKEQLLKETQTKLNVRLEQDQKAKEALLDKLPENKRGLYADASLEIINDVIGSVKTQTKDTLEPPIAQRNNLIEKQVQ